MSYSEYVQTEISRHGGNSLWYERFNKTMDYNNLNGEHGIPNGNYTVSEHIVKNNQQFNIPRGTEIVRLELDIKKTRDYDDDAWDRLGLICKLFKRVQLLVKTTDNIVELVNMNEIELYTYYVMNDIEPYIYRDNDDTRYRIEFPFKTRNTNSGIILIANQRNDICVNISCDCNLLVYNEYVSNYNDARRKLAQKDHPDIQDICKTLSVHEIQNKRTIDLNVTLNTTHTKYIVLYVTAFNDVNIRTDVITRVRYFIGNTEVRTLRPNFMRHNKTLKRTLPEGMYALSFVNTPDQYKNFVISENTDSMKLTIEYDFDHPIVFKLVTVEQQFIETSDGTTKIIQPNVPRGMFMGEDTFTVPHPDKFEIYKRKSDCD